MHRVKQPERGRKCPKKTGEVGGKEKKPTKHWKNKQAEQVSECQSLWKQGKFPFTRKEKRSCRLKVLLRTTNFFGWAKTDSHIYSISQIQTHRERDFHSLRPHLVIYIFSSVLLHYSIQGVFRDFKCTQKAMSSSCHIHSLSFQTLPRCLWGEVGSDNNVTGPVIERERNEAECSLHLEVSCLWKLIDVSQVGVIEDYFDAIQWVRLSYSLQLHLKDRQTQICSFTCSSEGTQVKSMWCFDTQACEVSLKVIV